MIVLRKYKEPDAKWEQITLEEAIDKLEGAGYWKKIQSKICLKMVKNFGRLTHFLKNNKEKQ